MNILVLGAGQIGTTLIEHLVLENHDITVVDLDAAKLQKLQARFDIRVTCGSAAHPMVLDKAEASEVDVLIAVTDSDEVNLLSCHFAHHLFDVPTKIARVRHLAYADKAAWMKTLLSVDACVDTDALIVQGLMRQIEYPGTLQVLDFAKGKIRLFGVVVQLPSFLVGKTIADLHHHLPHSIVSVVALYRDQIPLTVENQLIIHADDEMYLMARASDMREIIQALGHREAPYQKIIIAGGGGVGLRLAQSLELMHPVKIIEHDHARASHIAQQLDDALVLCGNATDSGLLKEEHVESADLFCALMSKDDTNMVACMQAKSQGAGKTLALVNDTNYLTWQERTGIDVLMSPQQIILGAMLRYLRRSDVIYDHTLRHGDAEAIEVIAHGDNQSSQVVGRLLSEIKLPPLTKVGAVVRDNRALVLSEQLVVLEHDHVVLWVGDVQYLSDVEALFQVNLSYFGD